MYNKCDKDKAVVKNMKALKAGAITYVNLQLILALSIPAAT